MHDSGACDRTLRYALVKLVSVNDSNDLSLTFGGTVVVGNLKLLYCSLVKFSCNSNTGTGFFLRFNSRLFVVTAAHVLANKTEISFEYANDCTDWIENRLKRVVLDPDEVYQYDRHFYNEKDVTAIHISTDGSPEKGVDGDVDIPNCFDLDSCQIFDEVEIGTQAYSLGFPVHIKDESQPTFDPDRAILRSGLVIDRHVLDGKCKVLWDDGTQHSENFENRKVLVLQVPTFPGDSGSPVVSADAGGINLIGVMTNVIPLAKDIRPFFGTGRKEYRTANLSSSGICTGDSITDLMNWIKSVCPR